MLCTNNPTLKNRAMFSLLDTHLKLKLFYITKNSIDLTLHSSHIVFIALHSTVCCRVLFNALNVTEHFWIGLRNVQTKKRNWYWIASNIAIPSPTESFFWYPSYPRDNDGYCGYIHYNDTVLTQRNKPSIYLNSLFSRNEQCSKELSFMCERVIS